MAYKITATNAEDTALLQGIRDLAWRERMQVSEVIREAFALRLDQAQDKRKR